LKIDHTLISEIEEKYLDKEMLEKDTYNLRISFTKGTKVNPISLKKKDDEKGEGEEINESTTVNEPSEEIETPSLHEDEEQIIKEKLRRK